MSSFLNSEPLMAVVVIVGSASMLVGLATLLVMLTVGFRKVVEAEKLAAPPGRDCGIRTARQLGDHLIGRMIRINYMAYFLTLRKLPGWGGRRAAKLGDVEAEVPQRLRRWILGLHFVFCLSGVLFFLCGGLMNWLDTGSVFG